MSPAGADGVWHTHAGGVSVTRVDVMRWITAARRSTERMGRRHPHVSAWFVFAVVISSVYRSVLSGSGSLVTNGPWSRPLFVRDPFGGGPVTAPLTRLSAQAWAHLQLPVIDPFQGFGVPLLANQGVPVYPPQILAHLLLPHDYSIWLVANLVALAFGVYLLARTVGQRWLGGLAAGFLAALAGAASPNVNLSVLDALAVFPFVLVALGHALDPTTRHRRVALLGLSTSVALLCLSGFQELLPLFAVVFIVFAVAFALHHRSVPRRPLVLASAAGSALCGVVIASIGILPALDLVRGGTGLNASTAHLSHVPAFWLSTLALPTLSWHAAAQAPQDLHVSVEVLGTPLLVVVVVLALAIAARARATATRYYVVPCVALVVVGVLAYADVGGILTLMGVPVFDAIYSVRFIGFAWWIPLCLLLGAVVSHASVLRRRDVLVALACAAGFDAVFLLRYRHALLAAGVAASSAVTAAPYVAAGVVALFCAGVLLARAAGPRAGAGVMALVVLASCLYDLPVKLAPSRDASVIATIRAPGVSLGRGTHLGYFGARQLPTDQHSVQIYGPVVPHAYASALTALFSPNDTGGNGPLYGALPTLATLTLTPRTVEKLRFLGVDVLTLARPLREVDFSARPRCSGPQTQSAQVVCSLGHLLSARPGVGFSPNVAYSYRVLGSSPLVVPHPHLVAVASRTAGMDDLAAALDGSPGSLPDTAFVTGLPAGARDALGVQGLARQATTERVTVTVRTESAGTVVLRAAYQDGMHASVDGRPEVALPVDGGLWSAVKVGPGTSRVVLDYLTRADRVELWVGGVGLGLLVALWLSLGAAGLGAAWRRRRGRRGRSVV